MAIDIGKIGQPGGPTQDQIDTTAESIFSVLDAGGQIATETDAETGTGSGLMTSEITKHAIETIVLDTFDPAPKENPTFTGSVTLPGAPVEDLEAATKKYVDDQTVEFATTAEIRASAVGNKVVVANSVEDACALVTLVDAATVEVDWNTFINGDLTLTDDQLIANPTNVQIGTVRTIIIKSNSATTRTPTFESYYKGAPTDSVTNTSVLVLSLFAYSATQIIVSSKLVTI